jgi:hypothetical protein
MAASLYFFTALQHCFRTAALALLDLGRLVALMAVPAVPHRLRICFSGSSWRFSRRGRSNPAVPTILRDG